MLRAAGRDEADAARLEQLFTEARQAEWAEFTADCGKFSAEVDAEIAKGKFTLAELEEEEQSLERLRRWHRKLATRDVFGAPGAAEAAQQLKHCTEKLAGYTDQVFACCTRCEARAAARRLTRSHDTARTPASTIL